MCESSKKKNITGCGYVQWLSEKRNIDSFQEKGEVGGGKIEKGASRCSGEVDRVASNGSEYGTESTLGNDEPCVSKQLAYMDPKQRHKEAQGGTRELS